jgi:hypothetical protein
MDHQTIAQLLGNYGEFIGATAVVATLIYLAIQIRQNSNSIQGSTELEAHAQFTAWYARVTSDPHLQAIYEQSARNEIMKPDDARTFMWLQAEYICMCEGWFFQFRRGLMAADAWEPFADATVGVLQSPYMREWWNARSSPLTQEFIDYIDQRRASSSGNWNLATTSEIIERAERDIKQNL